MRLRWCGMGMGVGLDGRPKGRSERARGPWKCGTREHHVFDSSLLVGLAELGLLVVVNRVH